MTFKEWIVKKHIKKDTAEGDLAKDIDRDVNFPSSGEREYLEMKKACWECLEVFDEVYKKYRKQIGGVSQ